MDSLGCEDASSRLILADNDKIGHSKSRWQANWPADKLDKREHQEQQQQLTLRGGLRKGAVAQGARRDSLERSRLGSNNGGSCISGEMVVMVAETESANVAKARATGSNNELAECGQLVNRNRATSSNNSNKSTYSNLFRQYLPSFSLLNLNTLTSNGGCLVGNGERIEQQLDLVGAGDDREQRQQQQQQQQVSKSIVGALSRLKLSATKTGLHKAGHRKHQQERETKAKLKTRVQVEGKLGGELSQAGKAAKHSTTNRCGQQSKIIHQEQEREREQHQNQVKRKGFLYLKSTVASGCVAVKSLRRKDINNNSLAYISSHNQSELAEGKTHLLSELENEEWLLESECEQSCQHKRGAVEVATIRDEQVEASMLRGSGTSKKTMSSQRKGNPKSAICLQASVCLTLVSLFALLALSTCLQPALGQQHFPLGSGRPSMGVPRDQSPVGTGGQPLERIPQAAVPQQGIGSQQQQQQQRPMPQPAAGSLLANINCNKIKGHVMLTPNQQGGTTVSTQISAGPAGEVYQWSVHQFPVKPGAAMCSCSALILGTKLIDLSEMHGNLPSDQEFSVQSTLNLFGSESPVGHSLLLRGIKTGMVACATFLPTSRKSNYRAKFHTPLSGSVTIFQTAFGTSFISHLMYSNGTRRHSMHRFDLLKSNDDIVAFPIQSAGTSGATPPTGTAAGIGSSSQLMQLEQREHDNELEQCKRFSNGEPLFKNITYQLAVSTENFGMRGRTATVLPPVPFETFSSVYLVIYSEYDPMEPIACAPLKFVRPKTAAAKFQSVSVQGSVVFSQESPYDVTIARVNLQMPNSDGHSYGIDELPMIIRRKSDTRVCPNIREIIYNPHHIEPSSVPPEGEATSDQYAVGDLSGKYGSLTGKASEKIQVNDFNLPLFGPASIVGRAMTVYSADGVAIACSNVELTTPMTTAFATFDFGIQGQFIFRQPQGDCNGDTYVYIEVSKPTGGSQSTMQQHQLSGLPEQHGRSLDQNWHIHVNPVDSGLDHLSTTDCAPAGHHFNPYNTSTSSIYSRDCTPFNVLRCELGDLSSKMFTIEIPPYRVKGGQEPDIGKFFGTDIDLPLCGPVSIVNRSVVVHQQDFGAQRLACSTVIEFKPRHSP